MKSSAVKMIISVALAVVLGVGGYFGTRQIITGGNSGSGSDLSGGGSSRSRDDDDGGGSSRSRDDDGGSQASRLRDNTDYAPVNFVWGDSDASVREDGNFLAGKYLRDDGNAVVFIDYGPNERDYFNFEIFIMATGSRDEFQTWGSAEITGRRAVCDDAIFFRSIEEGVLEVETDLPADYASGDGMYYIVRAKYIDTPDPTVQNDTSRLGGGGGGGGGSTPSPGGGGDQPPGGGGGGSTPSPGTGAGGGGGGGGGATNSTPEGAFRAIVLMMQEQDYSNREISSIYSRNEYDAVLRYYGTDSFMSELYGMRDELANDIAVDWAYEFGLDQQTSQRFGQDLFNAVIDWLKAFEYTVDSVEFVGEDAAYVHITVTQRVEFDFDYFMEYTIIEAFYTYCDFATMSEQEIAIWLFELVIDYMLNPEEYGDLYRPYQSYSVYTVKRDDTGWVVDAYDNDFDDMFFIFDTY